MTNAIEITDSDLWLDANQGLQKDDRAFGYIGTDETSENDEGNESELCGWFFSWPSDKPVISTKDERQAVIDSLELDETQRHLPCIPQSLAQEKLAKYLDERFGELAD